MRHRSRRLLNYSGESIQAGDVPKMRRSFRRRLASVLVVFLFVLGSAGAGEAYQCVFTRTGWTADDWTLVKSPRWDYFGQWVQKEDCIENQTPVGATAKELLGKFSHQTYTSMVLKQTFKGNIQVSSTMEFADRMAPLIVIAPALGKDAKGRPEYREHYEIVLFDQGINVWRHSFKDGKPSWIKAAYSKFPLHPNTKYRLVVRIRRTSKGKMLTVQVAGHEMGYTDNSLPDVVHVGITGCEGRNRFYDFQVEQ